MKNLCNLNIGHSYYNKGICLYKIANSVLEYQNSIEMYNIAKSYYKNINDINKCEDSINKCNAYIYQIYAKEEINIDYQLLNINKAISIWPEQRFGKNKSLLQDKGNFLINKGNEEFKSKHYDNAKDYFTKSYEVFLYISNEQCDNIKKGIERCDIYNKIESANNELFYNNLQEVYSLFLEALDRAKKLTIFGWKMKFRFTSIM